MAEAVRTSFLREWDTSLKIPALLVLMLSMAFVREPVLLPVLPLVATVLYALSGLPFSSLTSVLKAPLALVLAVGIFIVIFSGGETFLSIGPLSLSSEGSIQAAGILVRVASVIAVGAVATGTTSLVGLSRSLRRMLVPPLMVDMGMLTGRYIMVIGEDHRQMSLARKLRGYRSGRWFLQDLRVVAPSAATLLIRSFGRSERVFCAMKLRGYGQPHREGCSGSAQRSPRDILLLLATLAVAALLLILQFTWNG
jgi:cobalt/nickel transport system permease protein